MASVSTSKTSSLNPYRAQSTRGYRGRPPPPRVLCGPPNRRSSPGWSGHSSPLPGIALLQAIAAPEGPTESGRRVVAPLRQFNSPTIHAAGLSSAQPLGDPTRRTTACIPKERSPPPSVQWESLSPFMPRILGPASDGTQRAAAPGRATALASRKTATSRGGPSFQSGSTAGAAIAASSSCCARAASADARSRWSWQWWASRPRRRP